MAAAKTDSRRFVVQHEYGDTFIVDSLVDLNEVVDEFLADGVDESDFRVYELGDRVEFYVKREIVVL